MASPSNKEARLHRAQWAKYMRSLAAPQEREKRGEKVPQELVAKIVSLADKQYWYPADNMSSVVCKAIFLSFDISLFYTSKTNIFF